MENWSTKVKELLLDKEFEALFGDTRENVEQKIAQGISITGEPINTATPNHGDYETVSQATEALPLSEFDSTPLLFGAGGFALGALVAVLACRIKIKKIKAECETRVSEARDSLDRMISIMAKE